MDALDEIGRYIDAQPPAKRADLAELHRRILALSPDVALRFLDGRNHDGKVVSNPQIGYGSQPSRSAGGRPGTMFRLGLSANTAGLSLYVMGAASKAHLAETYGPRLGKAKISGYCIRFRSLKDVDAEVIEAIATAPWPRSKLEPSARVTGIVLAGSLV
mgnify:CR=1 FL=1